MDNEDAETKRARSRERQLGNGCLIFYALLIAGQRWLHKVSELWPSRVIWFFSLSRHLAESFTFRLA